MPRAVRRPAAFLALYAGRVSPGKGVDVLLDAWARTGLTPPEGALALAGPDAADLPAAAVASGTVVALGHVAPEQLRNLYAAADVLLVPSVPTRAFREPWALVVNEAMSQRTPIIATDAVGAAAGGLVRDGRRASSCRPVTPPRSPPRSRRCMGTRHFVIDWARRGRPRSPRTRRRRGRTRSVRRSTQRFPRTKAASVAPCAAPSSRARAAAGVPRHARGRPRGLPGAAEGRVP